jgi:hypothetical protein
VVILWGGFIGAEFPDEYARDSDVNCHSPVAHFFSDCPSADEFRTPGVGEITAFRRIAIAWY